MNFIESYADEYKKKEYKIDFGKIYKENIC